MISKDRDSATASVELVGRAEYLALSHGGKELAVALLSNDSEYDHDIAFLDVDTLRVKRRWPLPPPEPVRRFTVGGRTHPRRAILKDMVFTDGGRLLYTVFTNFIPVGIGYKSSWWQEDCGNLYDVATGEEKKGFLLKAPADLASAPDEPVLNQESIDYKYPKSPWKRLKLYKKGLEESSRMEFAYAPNGQPIVLSTGLFPTKAYAFYGAYVDQVYIKWEPFIAADRDEITRSGKVLYDRCFNAARTRLACWDWTDNTHAAARMIVWNLSDGSVASVTPVEGKIEGIAYDDTAGAFRANAAGGAMVYANK